MSSLLVLSSASYCVLASQWLDSYCLVMHPLEFILYRIFCTSLMCNLIYYQILKVFIIYFFTFSVCLFFFSHLLVFWLGLSLAVWWWFSKDLLIFLHSFFFLLFKSNHFTWPVFKCTGSFVTLNLQLSPSTAFLLQVLYFLSPEFIISSFV